ncbi:hypothetical protein AKJ65_07770 [candidate division MSBL1 archaeon SCGC-AAA259E19]|uniref:Uncharacterized protein n=1 Tax=candidate division MSBL1 archaeon SCGC-AAA259E19 TaxID=1698264 RepID=A0A133UDL0_9EURY|nr:hypothetical protein AKJ65_07770 [candidate division MSBL1 archaeon SCGC-AAA259E19]
MRSRNQSSSVRAQRSTSTESGIRTEGKLASEYWTMTKTITCRPFPEEAEFQSLEGEKSGKLVREREYRVEIPDRDFEKLEGDANEGEASLGEIIERRFFSVAER